MSLTEFVDGLEETKQGLCIIDFSAIALSTIFATFKPKEVCTEDDIKATCFNVIRSNVKKFKDDYPDIVLAIDAKGGYWRHDLANYYKGGRKKARDKTGRDFKLIFGAMNQIIEDLKKYFPYIVLDTARCEADDIGGVLCKHYHKKYEKILCVSTDFDWTQTQKFKNVKQWNPVQKKFVKPRTETGKPTCSPETILKHKCIKGDRKDGVSNMLSVGNSVTDEIRQKRVSSNNYTYWLNTPFEEWEPVYKEKFTDDEKHQADLDFVLIKERYVENKALLDLMAVRSDIEENILKDFEEYKPNGRMRIYSYLAKNGLTYLTDKVKDF